MYSVIRKRGIGNRAGTCSSKTGEFLSLCCYGYD